MVLSSLSARRLPKPANTTSKSCFERRRLGHHASDGLPVSHGIAQVEEPTTLTDAKQQPPAAGTEKPTLCFFYSPRSGPCRRVEAFLAQVLQRRRNHRTFALRRVNCDEHPELAERFQVRELPALVVLENRKIRSRIDGLCGCREIEKLLEPWLGADADREAGRRPETAAPSFAARAALAEVLPEAGSGGAADSPVRLELPAGLPFERWQAIGRRIGEVADASPWWLADWAAYGEGTYGDRYRQAIAVTGFGYQTLRNYAWVARRFDASRRRDDLSFAHHAEVAALDEQGQDGWLERARRGNWSRNELRAQLKRAQESRDGRGTEQVRLTAVPERLERWRAAAAAEGLEVAEWLGALADRAAHATA
jgi:thiol-disulfide isomerase/thioredoxin